MQASLNLLLVIFRLGAAEALFLHSAIASFHFPSAEKKTLRATLFSRGKKRGKKCNPARKFFTASDTRIFNGERK